MINDTWPKDWNKTTINSRSALFIFMTWSRYWKHWLIVFLHLQEDYIAELQETIKQLNKQKSSVSVVLIEYNTVSFQVDIIIIKNIIWIACIHYLHQAVRWILVLCSWVWWLFRLLISLVFLDRTSVLFIDSISKPSLTLLWIELEGTDAGPFNMKWKCC